jgi:hypothetical protein
MPIVRPCHLFRRFKPAPQIFYYTAAAARPSINPTANQYSLRDGRQVTVENDPDKVMPHQDAGPGNENQDIACTIKPHRIEQKAGENWCGTIRGRQD